MQEWIQWVTTRLSSNYVFGSALTLGAHLAHVRPYVHTIHNMNGWLKWLSQEYWESVQLKKYWESALVKSKVKSIGKVH